jgi:hypothetical protein
VLVAAALYASALPAGARATPQRSVFAGAGVFVDSLSDFPGPWALAEELQAAHFSWVAFRVDDAWAFGGMDPMWIDVFRAHGLSVGAWGKERANVATDVGVADLAIKTYGFDFYLADAEVPFESPTDGVAWAGRPSSFAPSGSCGPTCLQGSSRSGPRRRRTYCRSTTPRGVRAASSSCPRRTTTSIRRCCGPT